MASKNRHCSDFHHIANTRDLTKILTYLERVESAGINKIHQAINVQYSHVKDALNWLINHKFIYSKKTPKLNKVYIFITWIKLHDKKS